MDNSPVYVAPVINKKNSNMTTNKQFFSFLNSQEMNPKALDKNHLPPTLCDSFVNISKEIIPQILTNGEWMDKEKKLNLSSSTQLKTEKGRKDEV